MFERFTDRARYVLVLAQEEVRLLQGEYIGTEHLLLALLREGEGVAARALSQSGVTLDTCREKVASMSTPSPAAASIGSPAFSRGVKKVMEGALGQALQRSQNYIGPEHLLLALLDNPDNTALAVLVALHADPVEISRQIDEIISGNSPSGGSAPTNLRDVEGIDLTVTGSSGPRRRGYPADGPTCRQCRAPLRDWAQYCTIEVPPGTNEKSPDTLKFKILYCSRCGAVVTGSPEQ